MSDHQSDQGEAKPKPENPLLRLKKLLSQGDFTTLKKVASDLQTLAATLYIVKSFIAEESFSEAQALLVELESKDKDGQLKRQIVLERKKIDSIRKNKVIHLKDSDLQKNQDPSKLLRVGKTSFSWYQTPNTVGIQIQTKLQNPGDLSCSFQPKKAQVKFPMQFGQLFKRDFQLQGEIVPQKSDTKVHLNKVEIRMRKAKEGQSWKRLEQVEGEELKESVTYPSSSKNKKNWDKYESQLKREMQSNKQAWGVDPTNDLFQQIFKNGDEDTRRAMMRSFVTSGGTVLSTNWKEVKDKDYEDKDRPSAPQGQEWRKWEK